MYKVLIVDDEVLVRIGLKNTIDWESIGFTVVGEASNGEQGYAQFLKLEPDVVITDIKMPKQDGLWLTDKIHKEDKHAKILVLTCYDEFHYARTALKNGASDYILKSEIVDEELIALMIKLKTSLDEENIKSPDSASKAANHNAIKRSLLNDLIKVKFTFDERMRFRFEEQHFELTETKYAFLYLENKIKDKINSKQISETTVNLIIDLLNERGISYLFNGYMDEHLFLLSSKDLTLTMLGRIASTIQNGVDQYFGTAINLLFTNAFSELEDLAVNHEKLLDRIEMFYYVPSEDMFVENTDHVKIVHANTQELKNTYTHKLIDLIGQEETTQTLACLEEVFALFQSKNYPPRMLKLFVTQLYGELYNVFQYVFDAPEIAFSYSGFHESVLKTTHVSELKDIAEALAKSIVQELKYIRQHQSKHLIKRAINFIDHNYDQNISLEDVAKVINLSKQYVCSIFKKETGQNLSTYINQIRIEKAKQLLLNPANSNKDIYALVGYSNQQYFSRVFKKMTGMTTTEYKEQAREHFSSDEQEQE